MCLRASTYGFLVATEDIICYKCVRDDYYSPCYHLLYEVGSTANAAFFHEEANGKHYRLVYDGLHTFKNVPVAKSVIRDKIDWINFKNITEHGNYATKILKCIIPKGTKYFEGTTLIRGHNVKSYASEQLKIVEEIQCV